MLIIFDCRRFQKATITIRHLHQNSEEGIQAIRYKNKDSHTENKQIGQVNPSPPWSKYPAMRPWFAATIEPRVQYLQSLQRLCKFEPTTIIYMSYVFTRSVITTNGTTTADQRNCCWNRCGDRCWNRCGLRRLFHRDSWGCRLLPCDIYYLAGWRHQVCDAERGQRL